MEITQNAIEYCKVGLRVKWSKLRILSVNGNDNNDANSNNIIFNIQEIKLYLPVVTLSEKDNQKLSKLYGKGFERSVYWNEYKRKSKDKARHINIDQTNRLFVFVYSNQDDNAKRFRNRIFYLPKSIFKNYNVNINRRNFYEQKK